MGGATSGRFLITRLEDDLRDLPLVLDQLLRHVEAREALRHSLIVRVELQKDNVL